MADGPNAKSPWQRRSDLAWAHALLWFASATPGSEPKPHVHLFLAESYGELASYHARRGSRAKAARLSLKSVWHYRAGGFDKPPRAAAMAMPVPGSKPVDAVSYQSTDGDDVA